MGMSTGSDPAGLRSEINVTPLVDVVLVLLIIFMVIIPLTMRGYEVAIPGESTAAPSTEPRPEQIVLGIDLDGCPMLEPLAIEGLPASCRVSLNDEALPVDQLATRVTEIFGTREAADRVLFLAAHDRLNYEAVMRIIDVAKTGVADLRIGLVMRPEPRPLDARSV